MKHYDIAAYVWPAYTGDEMRSTLFFLNTCFSISIPPV